MNIVTNQLLLRFAMPEQVFMIGTATPRNLSERKLNIEIVIYRNDFDAGDLPSPLMGQADFGEYRVRKLFPEDCFINLSDSGEITSTDSGIQNIAGMKANIFHPDRITGKHLVIVVWRVSANDRRIHNHIDEHFRREMWRVLKGLTLAFTG